MKGPVSEPRYKMGGTPIYHQIGPIPSIARNFAVYFGNGYWQGPAMEEQATRLPRIQTAAGRCGLDGQARATSV
jgi:hypothetical protein